MLLLLVVLVWVLKVTTPEVSCQVVLATQWC
jgi:hypothetical protein